MQAQEEKYCIFSTEADGVANGDMSKGSTEEDSNVFKYVLDHEPSEPMTGFTELCDSDSTLDLPQEIFR